MYSFFSVIVDHWITRTKLSRFYCAGAYTW